MTVAYSYNAGIASNVGGVALNAGGIELNVGSVTFNEQICSTFFC